MKRTMLTATLAFAALGAAAQDTPESLRRASEPVPPGSAESMREEAASRFERPARQEPVAVGAAGEAVQKAGQEPRQSQTVPASGGAPVIVIQNQNVNDNALNADKDKKSMASLWWMIAIGALVGAGVGSVVGGVGAGVGALIGGLAALVVSLWTRQA